jgi:LysR family transcriptional regulator of abg operon
MIDSNKRVTALRKNSATAASLPRRKKRNPMKFHQLQYFAACAELGSVRAAALSLGLSAAAVSRAIIELEEELKTMLLSRQAQGMELTAAGRTLLAHAKLMRTQMEHAEQEMSALQARAPTRLAIGVTPWFAQALMPLVLVRFLQLRPDVKLEVQEVLGMTHGQLRDGTLDLTIGLNPPQQLSADFEVQPLFSYGSTIVCRKDHPLATARSIDELRDQHWTLSRDAYEYESAYHDLFGQDAAKPTPRIHVMRSALLSMTMVEHSDMLTISPWPLLESSWLRGRVQPIDLNLPLADRQTCLITRRNSRPTPTSRQFMRCLLSTLEQARHKPGSELQRLFRSIEAHPDLSALLQRAAAVDYGPGSGTAD